jgi:hypothetical protein
MDEIDDAIRLRAYALWERDGRPDGQHETHWKQALAELGLLDPVEAMGTKPNGTQKWRGIGARSNGNGSSP